MEIIFKFAGLSLAEQLKAKREAGLKSGDAKPKPAMAAPPKLDLIGEIKARAQRKKQMEEEG